MTKALIIVALVIFILTCVSVAALMLLWDWFDSSQDEADLDCENDAYLVDCARSVTKPRTESARISDMPEPTGY